MLVLSFPIAMEFNQKITVMPDGYVNLQGAGSTYILGLTVPEAVEAIKKAYTGVLHDPIINVDLTDFQKPYFVVLGQVGKPGQYDLRYDMTITQAVAVAGGFSPTAKTQVLYYHPISPSMMEVKVLNIKEILNGKKRERRSAPVARRYDLCSREIHNQVSEVRSVRHRILPEHGAHLAPFSEWCWIESRDDMILKYYKLGEQPFGVTPDPRFLYLSPTHREAMASVLYAVRSGRGFTALIAEPGMGKTTLLFNLLQQLGATSKTAFLFQAQDTPINFLRNLLADLGIEEDGQDLVRMQVKLNECLVRETSQGKSFVVVVDEAQNLDAPVLEVVRMLSNFETPREKLMHIILAGQPQLAEKLASPQLTQLRQRVSIVARLKPFNAEETRTYIEHRLMVAGYRKEQALFTDRAYEFIAKYSGGIPRNINNICFNAMSIGCATQRQTIQAAVVEEVLCDLDLLSLSARVPVAKYQANPAPTRQRVIGRMAAIFPQAWRMRAGVAALAVLLGGIGLSVLAKGQHTVAPRELGNSGCQFCSSRDFSARVCGPNGCPQSAGHRPAPRARLR